MTDREQYVPYSASTVQLYRFWSGHVDALDRHLSINNWALAAGVTLVLIAYPIARIVIPTVLHAVVPDIVRAMLNLI